MINSYRIALLCALVVEAGSASLGASQKGSTDRIAVIDAPRRYAEAELSRSLGREFEAPRTCSERGPGTTVLEILGPDAKVIRIHHYDKKVWRNIAVVREFIRRVLIGRPEGGTPQSSVYWAEFMPVEVSGSVEFRSGQKRRIEFANGYAHFEDEAGCQWWARYLGGDRSTWVVRK